MIDYVLAYGGGPKKLGRYDGRELVEAADRWRALAGGMVHISLNAIEKAIQTKIDEEGCGAFFAAYLHPHVEVNCVAHQHTLSVDTLNPRHGDMSGDMSGDFVT